MAISKYSRRFKIKLKGTLLQDFELECTDRGGNDLQPLYSETAAFIIALYFEEKKKRAANKISNTQESSKFAS